MSRLSRLLARRRAAGARRVLLVSMVLGAVFVAAVVALAAHVPGGGGHLTAVGPVSDANGFPVWYQDENGLKASLCLDGTDPLCGFLPGDIPDPNSPISFPDNFPEEAFYMLASTGMDTAGGGKATTVLALEAAFANAVQDGDQMVFGRVRHRITAGLQPGASYTFTHPYGTDTQVAEADGSIFWTDDIGTVPGAFEVALGSRIGPFLQSVSAPAGYLGDPNVDPTEITGSPFGTNFLRIEGPGIGAPGDPNLCGPEGSETSCIQTNLFAVQGKISPVTNEGVTVDRVTYSTTAAGQGTLDVFASSALLQSIEASGDRFDPTSLRGGDAGHYYARIDYAPGPPPDVSVANVGNDPPAIKTVTPVDLVQATAAYDADAQTLTIEATSSDLSAPPTLTAVGYGALAGGTLTVDTPAPPTSVQVRSSAGGSWIAPVVVNGNALPPIPVGAFAGLDQRVSVGASVSLDGTGSTGPVNSYSWTQTSGTSVPLTGANTATPTFTAPVAPATLTFELTVQGTGGPSTDSVDVVVIDEAPAPVANAGADQTVVQDTVVNLDGGRSSGDITGYTWTQTGGPSVTLSGADTQTPSFRSPKAQGTLTFELMVSGPGGTATDRVDVTTAPDALTVAQADYRSNSRQWRVRGTSSVSGPGVGVTIRLGAPDGPLVGTADVDAVGAWQFRESGSAVVPGPGAIVYIVSSSGGQAFQAVNIRN